MKKTILALTFLAFTGAGAFAQEKPVAGQVTNSAAKTTIKFKNSIHDFGTLEEGDPAVAEFTFKNTGKEPLIIQNVRPSCGCTTPYWSKEPIAPGKDGVIKASYGTKGRPGAFNKSVTVTSTAGTNILYIKGIVKRAPETSAPQSSSMMKTK